MSYTESANQRRIHMIDNINFEHTLCEDIENIFQAIITQTGTVLNIPASARSGAQISDFLEDKFIDYLNTVLHPRIYNPASAPKRNTKNPYDICWNYRYQDNSMNYDDIIWGDIKASKKSFDDSNPDLGTPTKMINFMLDGHFHMLFIFFEYDATTDDTVQLLKYENGKYAKCTLLKNINHTVRINPKPQFQVNINVSEEYRTNSEWIDMFEQKYNESLDRMIVNANLKKERMTSYFKQIRKLHNLDNEQ